MQNSFLARLIKPNKVSGSRFIFFFAEMCGTMSERSWPINACVPPLPPAAPCPSAAWNQSFRRKSGPATRGWRGSTSTKGYERRGPSPHPNTAMTQSQAGPSHSRAASLPTPPPPSSFSVPKLSSCLLISSSQDGRISRWWDVMLLSMWLLVLL